MVGIKQIPCLHTPKKNPAVPLPKARNNEELNGIKTKKDKRETTGHQGFLAYCNHFCITVSKLRNYLSREYCH